MEKNNIKTMENQKKIESDRSYRIALRINEYHLLLNNIYENLVDRDFELVEKDAKVLIMEIKFTIKSTKDDDF